jgi:hypothetical protein
MGAGRLAAQGILDYLCVRDAGARYDAGAETLFGIDLAERNFKRLSVA